MVASSPSNYEDPSRGFDALYLDEEDYAKFDKGVVEAREDTYEVQS